MSLLPLDFGLGVFVPSNIMWDVLPVMRWRPAAVGSTATTVAAAAAAFLGSAFFFSLRIFAGVARGTLHFLQVLV
jgi:hypothetical protein